MRPNLDQKSIVAEGNGHVSIARLAPEPAADPSPPRFSGKRWGVFLATLYPLLVVTPMVAFSLLNGVSDRLRIAEVGVDCAVVGLTILALQFVITARLSWVEAPFGLDVLLVFHRSMALVVTALLCVHPVLVARGEGWPLLTGLHVRWYIWVGRVAFALLLLQVIVSVSRRFIQLPYETWRRLHNPIALAILTLGFVHSVAAGDDMHGGALVVWGAMMAVALGFWVYRHVVQPRLLLRHPFCVVAVKSEAPRVWTLTLEPRGGRPFRFVPGQFVYLRLHGAAVPSEEHPFTIASSPGSLDGSSLAINPSRSLAISARSHGIRLTTQEGGNFSSPAWPGQISLTIKEIGDFTAGIGRVRPGDRATIQGPFGRFSHTLHRDERNLVFVAGGVGITPLMSMLRFMCDRRESRRVLLVYASRSAADVLFANELEAMQAREYPELQVVHVLADAPSSWAGETGRLDADRLVGLCGGIEGKAFYLCCPPPMAAALVRGLRRKGVSSRRIHADHFSL